MQNSSRVLTLILIEYGHFLPTTSEKVIFIGFFRQSDPQKESKCKNVQFLQWILKDDDVYFQKITAS